MAEASILTPTDRVPGPPPRLTAQARLHELAARLSRTLSLARALVQGGRTLDLTGIDDGVGILCAQALDLPLEQSRDLLPSLHAVRGELDLLSVAIHERAWRGGPSC